MQKLIVLLTLLLFPALAYAQGFGSPNGVGFPSNGSGSGGGLTSPVAVADGGTGLTSYTAGDTVYYLSGTTFSKLAKGTAGQLYQMNSGATAPQWSTMSGDVTIAAGGATTIKSSVALAGSPTTTTQSANDNSTKIATTAYADRKMTNPMTTTGDTIYSSDNSGTPARLAASGIGRQLTSNGTGVAPTWEDQTRMPNISQVIPRTLSWAQPTQVGSTGWSSFGFNSGSGVQQGTGSAANAADGSWLNYLSGSVSGNVAGFRGAPGSAYQLAPKFSMYVKTGANAADIQTCRIHIGLYSADPSASDTPSSHYMSFRYIPSLDGTAFWRTCTDNGSGTPTVTTTTAAIASNTAYHLYIDATNASSIKFYINGTLVATHTTTLPGATTTLQAVCFNTTLSAAGVNIKLGKCFVESY